MLCAVKPGTMSVCTVNVWRWCKDFHVGLQQRKKENRWIQKTGVIRNSAPIFLSLAIALSVTHSHTQTRVHTLTVKWGGAVTMRTSTWNLQLVTHWKTPHTHTHHQTEGCPLTPIQPLSLAWSTPLAYRCTGHSFLFTCVCVCKGRGGGGGGGPVTFSCQVFHLQFPCVKAKLHWSQMGYFLTTLVIWRKASIVSLNIILPSIIGSWIWKDCSRSALMSRTSEKSELFLFSTSFWDIFRCKGSQFLNM